MEQESNLYKAYKLAHRDRTVFIKNSILAIAIIICFGLGSIFFLNFLNNLVSSNLVMAILFWLIGLSLLPIVFLIIDLKSFLIWNVAFSFVSFLPFLFKAQWNYYFFVISGFLFLFLFVSRSIIQGESNVLLDLKWIRVVSKGSLVLLLAFVVIVASLAYFQGKPGQIEQSSEQVLDSLLVRSEGVQAAFGLQLTGTIDEILEDYIEKQISELDDPVQRSLVDKESFLIQSRSDFSEFFGVSLTGEEKLSSLLIEWIKVRWQVISPALKVALAFFIIFAILSLLKIVNIVFSIALAGLSWILVQILISLKYLKIKRIGIEKQEITIA
jgi:hypothetical protein